MACIRYAIEAETDPSHSSPGRQDLPMGVTVSTRFAMIPVPAIHDSNERTPRWWVAPLGHESQGGRYEGRCRCRYFDGGPLLDQYFLRLRRRAMGFANTRTDARLSCLPVRIVDPGLLPLVLSRLFPMRHRKWRREISFGGSHVYRGLLLVYGSGSSAALSQQNRRTPIAARQRPIDRSRLDSTRGLAGATPWRFNKN
jgi:hypothetical protein